MPHTRLIQVMQSLEFLGSVMERRMFGGYGLYLDGCFFGLIHGGGDFFLKADTNQLGDFEKFESHPFNPDPNKKAMGYWSVSDELMADKNTFERLSKEAVRLARVAKKAKK